MRVSVYVVDGSRQNVQRLYVTYTHKKSRIIKTNLCVQYVRTKNGSKPIKSAHRVVKNGFSVQNVVENALSAKQTATLSNVAVTLGCPYD